jgi:alpha-1,3-rhamnosyl/mannosyltransferase
MIAAKGTAALSRAKLTLAAHQTLPQYVFDARTATPHFPGIGRYAGSLARAIVPILGPSERLTVLCDADHPIELPSSGCAALEPVDLSPFSLDQQLRVPRLIKRLGAELYHSAYLVMPYRPGVPAIVTVYDLIPLRQPEHSTARARLLFRGAAWLAVRSARHLIAISEHCRQDFISEFGIAPDRITRIPLAASAAFAPRASEAIADVRSRHQLPPAYVLYLGSNKPHKNLQRLVEAWRIARSDGGLGGAVMAIAGAWDERYGSLRSTSADDRGIRWLGPVSDDDLPALYSGASCFVFPSLFEGFGLPVLEAMACGAPVICSDRTSLPEVAGGAALLVDPTDTAAIAAAIRRVTTEPELSARLRRSGVERAAGYSWDSAARATLAIYRKAVRV